MNTEVALVADVGGTNIRIALTTPDGLKEPQTWRCADFDTLETALRRYIELSGISSELSRAAIAVACPVESDWIDITNQKWSFSVTELRDSLGLDELQMVNDFIAVAASIPRLGPEDTLVLKPGVALEGGAIGVLGPGTGLGVSGLIAAEHGWIPVTAEGGHASLVANNELEWAVVDLLRQRFGRVSNERVLSGPGLANLYQALCTLAGEEPGDLSPADIVARAGSRPESMEARTVKMFSGWLGSVAGDLALSLAARGGVYVGGGVVPKMIEVFDSEYFAERFADKGRLSDYVEAIPVHLILDTGIALVGLAAILHTGRHDLAAEG